MKLPCSFDEVVDEIDRYTFYTRMEVAERVWQQALHPGWNVLQDVARFGVQPHQYDERMEQLYRDGDGFIFETMVFWVKFQRRHWTKLAVERLELHAGNQGRAREELQILVLGDGAGNDSLFLADCGFLVDYFDVPGSKVFEFAKKRFSAHGFLGERIHLVEDYQVCLQKRFDAIICFEVLEHLVDPLSTIRDIYSMLKPGGIALVTDDFGDIAAHLPTHLHATAGLMGKTPFLFRRNKLKLTWYNEEQLFKPCEYTKVAQTGLVDLLALWRDRKVRGFFFARYFGRLKCLRSKSIYVDA